MTTGIAVALLGIALTHAYQKKGISSGFGVLALSPPMIRLTPPRMLETSPSPLSSGCSVTVDEGHGVVNVFCFGVFAFPPL